MLKQGTPVIIITISGSPVADSKSGTPAIFQFQGFEGPCAEVIDEEGKLSYFSAFVVMQPLDDATRENIMQARKNAEAEARRKKSGIVTANIVPPKDLKH